MRPELPEVRDIDKEEFHSVKLAFRNLYRPIVQEPLSFCLLSPFPHLRANVVPVKVSSKHGSAFQNRSSYPRTRAVRLRRRRRRRGVWILLLLLLWFPSWEINLRARALDHHRLASNLDPGDNSYVHRCHVYVYKLPSTYVCNVQEYTAI